MRRATKAYKLISTLVSPIDLDRINSHGVYRITHLESPSDSYIGSTAYKRDDCLVASGFYQRWSMHLSDLRRGKHGNPNLQSLVNRLGIDGIRFEILDICNSKTECLDREQDRFEELKPSLNVHQNSRGRYKPVFQFDLNGNLINRFISMSRAADKLKIDRGSINNTCLGNRSSAGGFLWSFDNKVNAPVLTFIEQMDLNGNRVALHKTYADAAKAMGTCSSNSIRSQINGNQKHAYGFTWKETKMSAEERRERGLLRTVEGTI